MKFLKRMSVIRERENDDVFNEARRKRSRASWKGLFHIPWDPVWYNLIIVIEYFSIIGHSYNSVNGNCYPGKIEFWYAFDAICFVDVVLVLIGKYAPNIELSEVNPGKRPLTILILELISTLPVEVFFPRDDDFKIRIFCFLRLNRCLKIVRILHVLYLNLYRVHNKFLVRMIEMYMCVSFIVMLTYIVYCNAMCLISGCTEKLRCSSYRVIVMIVNKMGKAGFDIFPEDSSIWEIISAVTQLLAVWAIFNLTLGHLVLRLFSMNYNQTVFVTRCNNTVNKFIGFTSYATADIMSVYGIFWQQCRGYAIDKEVLYAITPAMRQSLLFDISWTAFQHSQLLRSMDLSLLRHIAVRMTIKFLLPGDFIFRKNELKDKMVYVVSGSIQLLSQIDGESPVFRLCSGTCLGESSLILSYPSANNVCCETFCEVLVLEKLDLWQGLSKYPVQHGIFQSMRQRFLKAKNVNSLAKTVKKSVHGNGLDTSMGDLFWIKHILHELMSVDPEARARHENQNIYLEYEIDRSELNRMVFCADYLDLLAIGERVAPDKDSVFVRSSFPCILQPHSILVYIWEGILIMLTAISFYFIPQMAFVIDEQPVWYSPFILTLTLIFWFDVCIQLSTSIQSRTKTVSRFSDILRERVEDLVFWTDLISCMPLEILSPVILPKITSQINARMHMNRLFKMFRIERLFRLWGQRFNANIVLSVFIKFSLINTFLTYVFYCKSFLLNKDMSDISKWFSAIQSVTRIGISEKTFQVEPIFCAFADLLCTGIDMHFHASIAAAYLLTQILRLESQHLCSDVIFTMKGHKRRLLRNKQRVCSFINSHWINNKCCDIMFADSQLLDVSKTLYNELLYDAVGETIRSSAFFQDCPDEMVYEVCNDVRMRLYPPEEVIIYAGDVTPEVYFLKLGVCVSLGDDGFTENRLRFADSINLLEACFDRPACKTCVTRSDCIMVVVDYRKLLRTVRRYQEEHRMLSAVISDSSDIKSDLDKNYNDDMHLDLVPLKSKSIHSFGFNLPPGSYEEYDYYVPFDKLYPFNFISYLMFRFTILPDGRFYYAWESIRCIFAVTTAILFFVPPLYYTSFWLVLSWSLDATAYLDIYVRLHVCYYDEEGLLIKHPIKTALHYLRNGFLIDLLAVLPITLLVSNVNTLAHANRLLQMHRYISFFTHLYRSSNGVLPLSYQLAYLPMLIIICHSAGTWLINSECEYNPTGITCAEDSFVATSPLSKPISSIRAHFYGVYIATSTITGIGLQGFEVSSNTCKVLIMILGAVSVLISLAVHSHLIVLSTYRRKVLMDYQQAFETLTKYLDNVKVGARLKKAMTDTVTLKWNVTKGRNVESLIKVFTPPLQVDILYGQYGPELFGKSIFAHKTVTFYKNLLPYMKNYLILKGGYLETINDVSQFTYILHKGNADVLGPDGSKLAVLYPGSMFGNLQDSKCSRLKVSVVANCNVSVMEIETEIFRKLLSYNAKIWAEFNSLQNKYVSYIPSLERTEAQEAKILDPVMHRLRLYKRTKQFLYAFILIVPCYVGIILELYQFAVKDSKYLIILYACDLFYAVYCAIKFRVEQYTWMDSLGTERRKSVHSLEKWFAVLSLVPIDVFAFHMSTGLVWKHTLLQVCRLNRYLRLYDLYLYFAEAEDKIDVNLYIIRLVYIVALGILILNFNACVIGASACFFSENIEPHVPSCEDLIKLQSSEKFKLYIKFLHISSDCLTHTSQKYYYPRGLKHIIMFIGVMIISHHLYIVCISQVLAVFLEGNQAMFNFTALADRINYFTDDENVSSSQVRNIFRYIKVLWVKKSGVITPGFLTDAPAYLKDAVALDAFSHLFVDHPIFGKCHEDCLRQIMQKLVPRTYCKNNYVVFCGDVDNSMYFVLKGRVVMLKENSLHFQDNVDRTLGETGTFGVLQGLYYKKPHTFTFMCVRESIILQLSLSDWEYLLDYFPASREIIYKAAEDYSNL